MKLRIMFETDNTEEERTAKMLAKELLDLVADANYLGQINAEAWCDHEDETRNTFLGHTHIRIQRTVQRN